MPVKRRMPKARSELSPAQVAFLIDGELSREDWQNLHEANRLAWLRHDDPPPAQCRDGSPGAAALVEQFGEEVLADYILEFPGFRPRWFWLVSRPERLRRRLGGIGEPWGDKQVSRGIPLIWNYGSHANLWADPPTPIDPAYPPLFESEPAYLRRHGLLRPEELEQLDEEAFRPESLLDMGLFD
jgi:hypothetical protein